MTGPGVRVAAGHPSLLTVAVAVRPSGFAIDVGGDGKVQTVHDGTELAAALSGLPLYGRDLRLWLRWPAEPDDQARVDGALAELADACGATVWVPAPGCTAVVLEGCWDVAARTPDGAVGSWCEYRPAGTRSSRFVVDGDGRLTPAGAVLVERAGGVCLVSSPPGDEPGAAQRFHALWPRDGLHHIDLTPLHDGRLAVPYSDGTLLAVGPRELERLLRVTEWRDEDLCLLTVVSARQAAGLAEHVRALADGLGVDIYVRSPDDLLSIQDGHPRVVGRDGQPSRWHRIPPGDRRHDSPRWRSEDGFLDPVPAPAELVPATDTPSALHSGLDWLPARPPVNAQPLWFSVHRTTTAPERAGSEGIASAELFLLGRLAPDGDSWDGGPDATPPDELRLRVGPGAAIDAAAVAARAPARLRARLSTPDTLLVPAGWLDRVTVAQPHDGAPSGADGHRPIVLRCTGATHGIDGVPDGVVWWPRRRHGRAYVVHPAPLGPDNSVPLYRERPQPLGATRLFELRLARQGAIDVPASAELVARLPLVRSRLGEFAADGIDLLLPAQLLDQAAVTRAFVAVEGVWRAASVPDGPVDLRATPE